MGERLNEIKGAVVQEQREYNQAQKSAWRYSRKWFLAVPIVVGVGFLIALAGSGVLDTIGGLTIGVGILLLFAALWKHVDAGGDDFGAGAGGAFGN